MCDKTRSFIIVITEMFLSALVKLTFTSLLFEVGLPGGVFMPLMSAGALFGRIIGSIIERWHINHANFILFSSCQPDRPCIMPETYAMLGAAALLGGSTRRTCKKFNSVISYNNV